MYQLLLSLHSGMRWIVLLSLLYAIARGVNGQRNKSGFSKWDNAARHWTATLSHIQLMIGIALYFQSPVTKHFWQHTGAAVHNRDTLFFGLIHMALMILAIVVLTIGSALAKRKQNDTDKFRTMLRWFATALLIICAAIPWPFSPFANRPYIR